MSPKPYSEDPTFGGGHFRRGLILQGIRPGKERKNLPGLHMCNPGAQAREEHPRLAIAVFISLLAFEPRTSGL